MPAAVNPRRGYDSPRRREQAAETRRKILDAAEELFARDGYAAIAMPAIADRAGVALKTVYLAFGTKAGVLHGLWDVRLGGDDQPIPVTERPWYRQLLQVGDPHQLVRTGARQSRVTKDRAGDLLWTLNHPDTWYLLVRQCGWTADAYEQWVGDTLSAQLLGPAGPGRPGEAASNPGFAVPHSQANPGHSLIRADTA